MDTPDYNYSSLSELESLSDSDWLDISSRGDEDSVAGFDSDHEDSRPVSRRSFNSVPSSRGEVVEGWEGLIEDVSDETPFVEHEALDLMLQAVADGEHSGDASFSTVQEEDPEDERVKAALDQSMMSTLSSPRSHSLSNSVQTSIVHSTRSLRLSFPDPTHSRLQSMHTSFEELSAVEADVSSSDAAVDPAIPRVQSAADSDHLSTSDVHDDEAHDAELVRTQPSALQVDFYVVLYGSALASKFSLVEMLLEKWAMTGNFIRGQKYIHNANTVIHEYECFTSGTKSMKRIVSVIDQTGIDNSNLQLELHGPSLAIIFLPSFSDISLAEHTLYLPLMMSSPPSLVDVLGATDYLLEAEQQWETQLVPSAQLTSFSQHTSPVVEQEALEKATAQQVAQALRPLFPASAKTLVPKVSANAFTIFAILSIVLGYIVHGSLNATGIETLTNRTIATPLMGLLRPSLAVANKSQPTGLITVGPTNLALSTHAFKHLDVAVFNPSTSVEASATAQPSSSSSTAAVSKPRATSTDPAECECGCGLLTWPGKTETTDIMLRPTSSSLSAKADTITSISIISSPSQHKDKGKGKAKASAVDTSLYALSTRIVTSLSEYFEFTPLGKPTDQDLQELFDAIDQLSSAISRQTSELWEQSKGTVSTIQDKLEKRNERAKRRAREMRQIGESWISSVKEKIKTHTELAKVNAKAITEQVVEHLETRHKRSLERARGRRHRRERRVQSKIARPASF
ncbi:hypothetical protein BDW22DRAFT_1357263 [Trametopsis cervina]|nr:hypothetical protein BDW22DRAFT_1357263 [Trametopsis cervina]